MRDSAIRLALGERCGMAIRDDLRNLNVSQLKGVRDVLELTGCGDVGEEWVVGANAGSHATAKPLF